jgi:hypothetical protein
MFENKEHKVVFKNDWVELKESLDGFFYLQRKGKNSIAVLLYNDQGEVLVRYQPMCAVEKLGESLNRIAPCPITGSIDDKEEYLETAIREVKEEAGYDVRDYIKSTGSYIVSTQCNEICYTYIANVSSLTPEESKGDGGYHESISYNKWVKIEDVPKLENIYGGLLILLNQVVAERHVCSPDYLVDKYLGSVQVSEMFDFILGFDELNDKGDLTEIVEKIDPKMSFNDIVREIMQSYKKTGKIGNSEPEDDEHARKQAIGIAYSIKK